MIIATCFSASPNVVDLSRAKLFSLLRPLSFSSISMSQPPPYGGGPPRTNPDARPLPSGWITQFDPNYNAWFYVNTLASPPITTWTHPLGAPPPPPTTSRLCSAIGASSSQQQQQQVLTRHNKAVATTEVTTEATSNLPLPVNINLTIRATKDLPLKTKVAKIAKSGLFGGMFGNHQQQPPPVQTVYVQEQPKKSGMGMGGALALGAGGLLGGALLASAFDGGDDGGGDDGGGWGGDDGGGDDGGGDW
ncbi:WW domain-containing protein [Mycena indigotica]|uniref:WW domain-containing protein n=1 Tax=Mycena indigotica TaxID=2126181 RepID=A0A8H6SLS6_9AGAR|nr:WW domain-containing protein [Mycena indigotica]KAF7301170.1 WW domain-containing protein [Mycena indigotica]